MKLRDALMVLVVFASGAAGAIAQKPTKFSSVYTPLHKGCKTLRVKGTDPAFLCRGAAGYRVRVYYSAATTQINAERTRSDESVSLGNLDLGFDQSKVVLEWRLANGKPFAVIMRVPEYGQPASGEYFGKVVGERLRAAGLVGYQIDEVVDAALPGANAKIRQLTDQAYLNGIK